MNAVYKYPLPLPGQTEDTFTVDIPAGAQLLTVQLQRGEPVLWALVDPEDRPTPYTLRIAGTGHPLDASAHYHHYLGTVQMAGGALVFHYFQVVPF